MRKKRKNVQRKRRSFFGVFLSGIGVVLGAVYGLLYWQGVCLYVYVYNVQPGVVIDYATGERGRYEEGT